MAIAQVPISQIDVFITAVIKLYPVLVVTVYVGNDTLSRRHIFVDNHPDALCFGLFGCFSCDFCGMRSEDHTSELQSRGHLVCRLLLENKKHLKIDLESA